MANEDYDGQDVVLTDVEDTEETDLVPVISKELESEIVMSGSDPIPETKDEQLYEQGCNELSNALIVNDSLEAYRDLLVNVGLVGIKPEAVKVLKIGLESIDVSLSSSLENYDYKSNFIFKEQLSLENSVTDYIKKVSERIVKLINWLIEKANELFLKYKEGFNKLENRLKDLNTRIDKLKGNHSVDIKMGNAYELFIDKEFVGKDPSKLAGLAAFVSKEYPNALIKKYDLVLNIISKIDLDKDDIKEVTSKITDGLLETPLGDEAFSKVNHFPGNYALVLNEDGTEYRMQLDEDIPIKKEHEFKTDSLNGIRSRHMILLEIVKMVIKAASTNVTANKKVKEIGNNIDKLIKKLSKLESLSEAEKTEIVDEAAKWPSRIKKQTPGMLSVVRYIAKSLNNYTALLEQEVKLYEGASK